MVYLIGYGLFLLGALLYILGKVQEFKSMAETANKTFKFKTLFNKEWINYLRLLLGGIALVILGPMLAGSSMVELKTVAGTMITNISFKMALTPLYFFIGYGGNSALFNFFGKYKKTLLEKTTPE